MFSPTRALSPTAQRILIRGIIYWLKSRQYFRVILSRNPYLWIRPSLWLESVVYAIVPVVTNSSLSCFTTRVTVRHNEFLSLARLRSWLQTIARTIAHKIHVNHYLIDPTAPRESRYPLFVQYLCYWLQLTDEDVRDRYLLVILQ